ncbi:MAG: glutamine--tRNA ligase/YqeY domain fusion protein [Candidatus Bipolaricaulia bacterium]
MSDNGTDEPLDFIRQIIEEDVANGVNDGRVHTRFPPEPNGYLHIGHSKAIVLNFSVAEEYHGKCNLRFDDTNPIAEENHYAEAMKEDVQWLGFDWEDREFYASDYFDQLYEFAVDLIKKGKAYVDSLSPDEIREYRGSWNEPGTDSPYRNRSVEENLDLFERMKNGEFAEGEAVLRAKIDMAASNMNMRDPVLYRVLHASHHRTGDDWCVYPTYDMAHGQSDAIEGITHSLCSLEFQDHRPLYNWLIEQLEFENPPKQIEFARLNISYTVLSKRKLIELVEQGHVSGWDDPRMPTLRGMRRRGFPPKAIRDFCHQIGVAKKNSVHEMGMLEECVRDVLNQSAPRRMGVLRPLKLVIENYPEGEVEYLDAVNNPEDESAGMRQIPFSRELYIEQDDFMEDPPKKFYRLTPDREIRLRYGYFVTCTDVVKDDEGNIVEVRCTYDPETRGGYAPDGRKVKSTLHWVSAPHAVQVEARLYDRLFNREAPTDVDEGEDWTDSLNPDSLEVVDGCLAEPSVQELAAGETIQFERLGYFRIDEDSSDDRVVLNRAVTLKDQWSKIQVEERKAKKRREKEREKERQRQQQQQS